MNLGYIWTIPSAKQVVQQPGQPLVQFEAADLASIAVFIPLTLYGALGKRPPEWMILGGFLMAAVQGIMILNQAINPQVLAGLGDCNCNAMK